MESSDDAYAHGRTSSRAWTAAVERERGGERKRKRERPVRHFIRSWSQALFASNGRKRWGVRTERVKASFVTMRRDVSGETSGRKQLDDLSTPWPGYGEWFYRHLLLSRKSNQGADGTDAGNRESGSHRINANERALQCMVLVYSRILRLSRHANASNWYSQRSSPSSEQSRQS